jgi:hypothetical protein
MVNHTAMPKARLYLMLFVAVMAAGFPVLLKSGTALAQSGLHSPVNHALGGGGSAYMDSYQANFINPANLLLNTDRRPAFTFGLLGSTGATMGGSAVNISAYNKYLTSGLTIRGEVAAEMLDQWFGVSPQNIRSVDFQADHIPLGIAWRGDSWGVGFAVRSRVMADIEANRGIAELFLHGLDSDIFQDGRPVSMNMESLVFSEFSMGFAREAAGISTRLGMAEDVKLYLGAAPKLILSQSASGFELNSILQVEGSDINHNGRIYHDFNYRLEATGNTADQLRQYQADRRAEGADVSVEDYLDPVPSDFYGIQAAGFGIDLGATLEMNAAGFLPDAGIFKGEKKLRLALSLNDIGAVRFGNRSGVFSASGIVDWQGFESDQETIDRDFDGDRGAYYESVLVDSIGSEIYGNIMTMDGETVSRNLPATVNMGAHLMAGRFGLMMDVGKGFNNRGVNSRRMYVALGTEYRFFGFLPIRLGARTGGFSSTSIHAGTGLEFKNFEFSLSASTVPKSTRYGSSAGFAWSGLVFHF